MGKLTGEWKQVNSTWFQKEIIQRWVRYAEIECAECKKKFKTRHESETCSKKCMAIYRWKNTPPDKRWRATGEKLHNGYKMIHVKGTSRLVPEHRHIMEQKIDRPLTKQDQIHHRNGIRTDNRIENLVLLTRADHNTLHKAAQAKEAKRNENGRFT